MSNENATPRATADSTCSLFMVEFSRYTNDFASGFLSRCRRTTRPARSGGRDATEHAAELLIAPSRSRLVERFWVHPPKTFRKGIGSGSIRREIFGRGVVQPWNADNPPLRCGLSTFLFLFGVLSFEHKQALFLALDKLANNLMARSQQIRDQARRAIADTQPNKLGWMPEHDGSLVKVCILGDNDKSMLFGPLPKDAVVNAPKCIQRPKGVRDRRRGASANANGPPNFPRSIERQGAAAAQGCGDDDDPPARDAPERRRRAQPAP